jgi:basic membrane lipoprotein Med (substrate-binding protein (PBP1-ABC) superfamily)
MLICLLKMILGLSIHSESRRVKKRMMMGKGGDNDKQFNFSVRSVAQRDVRTVKMITVE